MRAMPSHPFSAPDTVTVYGTELCVDCRRTRRYLDATHTPYRWVDVGADPDQRAMLDAAGYRALPVVALPTGQVLVEPSDDELANVIGTAA
jgi:glutaredoxin